MIEASPAFERISGALSRAYRIERELGRGGMATVYLAEDLKHHRPVAVKVLHPELAAALGHERFLREVEIAARLQHPHILTLIDSGEADGFLYYVMPFVDGGSLRARLAQEHELPIADVVRIIREVADALAEAHAHGVVHRDIKPDNILLRGHHVVVTDFGIAKAVSEATGVHAVTSIGVTLGTPTYMAPEQAAGDPAIDHRADIYALGVMAYEMLTGAPPFTGATAQAVLVAHMTLEPESIASRRAAVPAALNAVILRCLEKKPADRWQSVNDLLAQLEAMSTPGGGMLPLSPAATRESGLRKSSTRNRILALIAVLAVAGVAGYALRARIPTRAVDRARPPRVVVLPFENLGAPNDEYFADGMTEELADRLGKLAGLAVIARTSAIQYKKTTKPITQIAKELGADFLVEGTVRWQRTADGGGRVLVAPQVIRASDGTRVWGDRFDKPYGTDVFAIQSDIAEQVARAMDVTLDPGDRRVAREVPTTNLAAYDAYLRGLAYPADGDFVSARMRHDAIEALQHAVELDPQFAAAHARLALAYLDERAFGRETGMLERARASAGRALKLDSGLVASRLARAQLLSAEGDHEGAYHALTDVARVTPNDPAVLYWTGREQRYLERPAAAVESFRRAAELDPRWASPVGQLAGAYDWLGRHEDAIRAREREMALMPQAMPWSYAFQAASYLLLRADTAAARRMLARGDPRMVVEALTWAVWIPPAGRAIWLDLVPPAVLHAKDTLTLAGYLAANWGKATPDRYHFMKAAHFALTGRRERARAHADSVIALLEPALRRGPDTTSFAFFGHSQQAMLAEAYAYAGRASDAARLIDQYVEDARRSPNGPGGPQPSTAFVAAAYVDVLIGRPDSAVARLTEALRRPTGLWISRPLLRADPSWAPLRGHPGFERLVSGR